MSRLAGAIDGVIGVDTHRDSLAAATTDTVGGLLAQTSVTADAAGYRRLLDFGVAQVPGRRCWAVEGAGSYGAGLAAFLQTRGERVVEVGRPKRPPRRAGAKTDALDAIRAAQQALIDEHPLAPRRRGDREALRVLLATRHSACAAKVGATNQLKALIVGAPEELRAELRGINSKRQVRRCASLRDRPAHPTAGRRGGRAAGRARAAGRRGGAVAAGVARGRAHQRRPSAGELVARWPAALRGRVRGAGWRQSDPGLLRAGHQASAEPLRGSAAQSRPAHGRGGTAARRPADPCLCRSAEDRGQERPRRPAMPEAGGRQAAVQAAGMAGPARRGAGQPLVAASASAPCRLLAIGAQLALAQARLPHHRGGERRCWRLGAPGY